MAGASSWSFTEADAADIAGVHRVFKVGGAQRFFDQGRGGMSRLPDPQADGLELRCRNHALRDLTQALKGVGMQSLQQGVHGVRSLCQVHQVHQA